MAELLVPSSPGELIDKITILEIKSQRMTDAAKLHNVRTELSLLSDTWKASPFSATDISTEWAGLRDVNAKLWDIEDRIRDKERDGLFDASRVCRGNRVVAHHQPQLEQMRKRTGWSA